MFSIYIKEYVSDNVFTERKALLYPNLMTLFCSSDSDALDQTDGVNDKQFDTKWVDVAASVAVVVPTSVTHIVKVFINLRILFIYYCFINGIAWRS